MVGNKGSYDDGAFGERLSASDAFYFLLVFFAEEVEADAIVLVFAYEALEFISEAKVVGFVEVAFEDGELDPLSVVFEGFEDAVSSLVVFDVVRDDDEHRLPPLLNEEWGVFGDFGLKEFCEETDLNFEALEVGDFVAEDGVFNFGSLFFFVLLEEFFEGVVMEAVDIAGLYGEVV